MNVNNHKSHSEYLAHVPEADKAPLKRLSKIIKATVPDAEEFMKYQIPTFRYLGKDLVSYASQKDHMSFYLMSITAGNGFEKETEEFKYSGGTLRFTPEHEIPEELIVKLIHSKMRIIEDLVK